MTSAKRNSKQHAGVALATGKPAARLPHVHLATDAWTITSATPPDASLLDVAVLEQLLPGALGRYVLPADAVLTSASWAVDLKALLRAEARCGTAAARSRHHHVTVERAIEEDVVADEAADASDEDEEDDELDDDCGQDDDDANNPEEDWGSDEDEPADKGK